MIKYLKVEGLNNRLDGAFEFNEDLNIFTGPNGSCKTTLLKLIWYFISGNLQQIVLEIPFNFISIRTSSFTLTVTHVKSNKIEFDCRFNQQKKSVSVIVNVNPETDTIERYSDADELYEISRQIIGVMKSSLFFPTFRRIENEFTSLSKYSVPTNDEIRDSARPSLVLGRLQEALSYLSTVLSVEEHRFITSISTHDIVRLLTQEYADVSGKINDLHTTLTNEITKKIQAYSNNGKKSKTQKSQDAVPVLDNIQNSVEQVTQTRKDLLKPFAVLRDLTQEILKYESISITEEIISSEGIEGITLGRGADGITFGAAKDAAISSDKLSSGEKQMLSFLCYNAFSKDTAIFIDEPELSLHIDWQRLLLPTLLDQSTGNQFFIATHSPFIFSGYQHKEIPLKSDWGDKGEAI